MTKQYFSEKGVEGMHKVGTRDYDDSGNILILVTIIKKILNTLQ